MREGHDSMLTGRPLLDPPDMALDQDLRWILLVAFSNAPHFATLPASSRRTYEMIRQLSLVGTVASRLSQQELESVLTVEHHDRLREVTLRQLGQSLAVRRAQRMVIQAARRCRARAALLKQAALEYLIPAARERRFATDVDVLVVPSDVTHLAEALIADGCRPETSKPHVHGVQVVRTPDGIGIELHKKIVGLTLGDGLPAVGFEALDCLGRLTPGDGDLQGVWLPSLDVVAAQLVAQGWYLFHYVPNAPQHKSPLRLLCDLNLVGAAHNEELVRTVRGLLQDEGPRAELDALVELVRLLSNGDLDQITGEPKRMLDHALASLLDEQYRRSLLWGRQLYAIEQEGLWRWTQRQVARAISPRGSRIDSLVASGRAGSRLEARIVVATELIRDGLRGLESLLRRRS